jgi:hypothetical protein
MVINVDLNGDPVSRPFYDEIIIGIYLNVELCV